MSDFHAPRSLSVDFTHPNPTIVSAYSICRTAEHVVDQPLDDPTKKANLKLINIRILGHLLSQSCLLQDEAISTVAISIVSCRTGAAGPDERDVEALNELGKYYSNYLIRPFRKFKGLTPDVSSPPSRPSSKLTKEKVDQILADTSKSYSKWKDLAMQREDFRCIVTRVLDMTYAEKNQFPRDTKVETLEFCHIFAEPTNYDIEDNTNKRDYSCNTWSMLKSFGYTRIVEDLASAEKIHSLENVMVMSHTLRDHFDKLNMWFEPIEGAPNHYRIRAVWGLPGPLADGQEITLQSTDPRLALPNPEYLRIHAACCRVAHLSGASGLFNKLERDMAADPDPTTEAQDFARALHAHLDHLALTANEIH
uniref:N/A n=1 Tax=Ganoderma boninense TaxID=34458 RepID=A0A5K1JSF3_9APHY|nr:N/A [Ganoderma boninense]